MTGRVESRRNRGGSNANQVSGYVVQVAFEAKLQTVAQAHHWPDQAHVGDLSLSGIPQLVRHVRGP